MANTKKPQGLRGKPVMPAKKYRPAKGRAY